MLPALGFSTHTGQVPKGTAENVEFETQFGRSFGTRVLEDWSPTLKALGYFQLTLRVKDKSAHGI